MNCVKAFLFFGCFFAAVANVAAETWAVSGAPRNASASKAAMISNDHGHVLYLWSSSQGEGVELFGELQLGPNATFSNKTPRYQIDQGMIVMLNRVPIQAFKSKEGWLRITDKMATWKLYDGTSRSVAKDEPFYSWLIGERIRFIYFDIDGNERTTEFSLEGASHSIARVTGINSK